MGTYYNAREVVQRGTRITSYGRDRRPSVREGEVLVGILNNGLWAVAPDVTSESEFRYFHDSYSQGYWLGMDVYALPKSEVPNCQDKGQVNLPDLEKILKEHPPKTEARF